MRLWSLHPKYLDSKGLVALWRESLLAQAVLTGQTKGYRNHPQLERFKAQSDPLKTIGAYLALLQEEATLRAYEFDARKIIRPASAKASEKIQVSRGQLSFEWAHLMKKLAVRDRAWLLELEQVKRPFSHSLFRVVPGPVESWERDASVV